MGQMMYKQVYELTLDDLMNFPIWYFPMDETVEDELSVRPLQSIDLAGTCPQIIIRTIFFDAFGSRYFGYIYWGVDSRVEQCQPVLYLSNDKGFAFWFGSIDPDDEDLNKDLRGISNLFPISFESEEVMGFSKLSGKLEGVYYMERSGKVRMVG